MNRKKVWLALAACIVLFGVALAVSTVVSDEDIKGSGGSNIVINEILASNRTYPAPNGEYLDYVEVTNLSDSPIDISGYMLSDALDSIGYTFPKGTVLQPGGCAICWCNKDVESDSYGSFGISKDGTDTIYLYNTVNVQIDQVNVPRVDPNVPLIRQADGTWAATQLATPGYENTEAGYAVWLSSMSNDDIQVVISEVVTGSDCVSLDNTARVCDWIELYNAGSKTAVLDGAYLSDDAINRVKWQIGSLTLEPGKYAVIPCIGASAGEGEATFALPRDGCTVVLTGRLGNIISQVECPEMGYDTAWALQTDGTYRQTIQVSPGYENTEAGHQAWLDTVGAQNTDIVISEVVTSNYSTVMNSAGQLCDWIELHNTGSSTVNLKGMYLTNDIADRGKFQLGDITMAPGEYIVICCSDDDATAGEADFALPREGCTVLLSGPVGNTVSSVEVPKLNKDRSWARQADGTYAETAMVTPGFSNDSEGRRAYNATLTMPVGLIISEVMPSNSKYYRQSDGKYYDWVELRNTSETSINLSNYALTDSPDDPYRFKLPDKVLDPGETAIIICSGNTEMTTGTYTHAPFSIGRSESWVYLTGPDGKFADMISVIDVPYQCSVGRVSGDAGTYYFSAPTPGAENGTGVAFISATPSITTKDGVYNDVTGVSVAMEGKAIRYTLDGSIPDADSPLYTGPISLTKTTVVRAASFEEGGMPSDVVTASYIINENHTLPVISVAAEDADLFGGTGIYVQYRTEREVLCNVTLYEGDGGFSIDCGIEMFGHTGLQAPKKSFKINFRSRYGDPYLNYPVFGKEGVDVYESLLIRSGQDYPKSIFRDELFTSLCADASDTVLTQKNKFCILYINGEYFGIYCLKEAFSETYYAENQGVTADSVEVVQAPFATGTEMWDLYKFCRNNDLTISQNYEYVASQIDVDSMIDWMIFEAYCTNGDVQQNLRYFRSSENGNKWQFAYYDLDWAFYYENGFIHTLDPDKSWQHMGFTRSMAKNATFREKLLKRCSELYYGGLSNETVLERIDYYYEMLKPEVERERDRWTSSYAAWENEVQHLRDFVSARDHWGGLINHLKRYVGLTDAEEATYFGR
ncbi:MAG: lamin tail domain-containing protein [Oscillospiraceae bacterium]|nr:lamin tail domain-containing protein [Oscillospiraceae bacterium]